MRNVRTPPTASHRFAYCSLALLAFTFLSVAAPKPAGSEKIIGGDDATPGDYPWMTALVSKGAGSIFDNQFCGGALIAPDWVLTAAHCVEGETINSFNVWVGIHDLDAPGSAVKRSVTQIIRHPSYFASPFDDLFNDVALLRLSSPVTEFEPIELASLASHNTVGSAVRVIGWGALDASNTPFYPTILQEVDLEIVGLSGQQVYYDGILGTSHLAAGAPPDFEEDSCSGDSGGPLFRMIADEPVLVGIVSFGIGCAEPDIAGIYSNILNLRSWIVGAMNGTLPTTAADPNGPLIDSLTKRIAKLKRKAKTARRKGQFAKVKRLKKQQKKLQRQLRSL